MKRVSWNRDWFFYNANSNKETVTLPHDAMIHEQRGADITDGGHGYFPGGRYTYEKCFAAPAEWAEKTVMLEFEGVYRNCTVFVNGSRIGEHKYGYTPFVICLDGHLNYGAENTVTVEVDNSQTPNSRWYSGSGIYRPVNLIVANRVHIAHEGVQIKTLSYTPARISVQTEATGGEVNVEILDGEVVVAAGKGNSVELDIPKAKLWSCDTPNLYNYRVTLCENGEIADEETGHFGIRKVEWSTKGLFVNGQKTLLKGGCYHHDNGILGAVTYAKSEERRVRIMKENGFNALRSSHNPTSKAMLDACDKYGIYLMDETFDMWYQHKTKHDYATDFEQSWAEDTTAMIRRDFNHPSVIMYSIGNEVSEPYNEKGLAQQKALIDLVHSLDNSRPVTAGINLTILAGAAKGKGVYQDNTNDGEKKPQKQQAQGNSSLMFNMVASLVGTGMNKAPASGPVDKVTTPCLDQLDIAGYNYASGRYALEGKQHPNRIVVGSETFPQDIWKNWEMVKKYPYLIGDFMWTAWDYLGEAGLGAWSYTGGMPFNRPYPWVLAGAGVIDILGNPDASCKYAGVVWDTVEKPVIGVQPVNHPGVQVAKSVWCGTNAIESWAWRGCDGNKAVVEVFAKGSRVELLINGRSLGRKRLKECKATYKTRYASGTITAIVYDASGREIARSTMEPSAGELIIALKPEENTVTAGDIVYIPVQIVGENGVVECNADRKLTASVSGGTLLGFGSANPCTEERYDSGSFTTYQGRALAVVRADETGEIRLTVSDGKQSVHTTITIQE